MTIRTGNPEPTAEQNSKRPSATLGALLLAFGILISIAGSGVLAAGILR